MKTAILFSGGKDSCYSAYLAKKKNYELICLISVFSENKDSRGQGKYRISGKYLQ